MIALGGNLAEQIRQCPELNCRSAPVSVAEKSLRNNGLTGRNGDAYTAVYGKHRQRAVTAYSCGETGLFSLRRTDYPSDVGGMSKPTTHDEPQNGVMGMVPVAPGSSSVS